MAKANWIRTILPEVFAALLAVPLIFGNGGADALSLQTTEAWLNGAPLPTSTGQITTESECGQINARNLALAPKLGYSVDYQNGTLTDPVSGITIRQGCVPAEPYYTNPPHPFSGEPPRLQPKQVTIGVCTEIILTLGQSNGGNHARGRYTASEFTWAYGGSGYFYQLSDPVAGQDGTDASPWPRLADMLLGQPHINPACSAGINRVIFVARNVGGSCLKDWIPGGSLNAWLISQVNDAIAHGLTPTRILWHQGECDAQSASWDQFGTYSATYQARFQEVLSTLRGLGLQAPIYVATATICNLRAAENPSPKDILWRTPDSYVWKEVARLAIRDAQRALVDGVNKRAGPNTDLIDWRSRASGDGCHFGETGNIEHAKMWKNALIPSSTYGAALRR